MAKLRKNTLQFLATIVENAESTSIYSKEEIRYRTDLGCEQSNFLLAEAPMQQLRVRFS